VSVIDLGTQTGEWKGETKQTPQVMFRFEIPSLRTEGEIDMPLTIWTQRYTASVGEKSNLRKFLEQWRGSRFSPKDLDKFSLSNLLGKTCLLAVEEYTTKDGKDRSRIVSAMPLAKGMVCPDAEHELVVFDLAAPNLQVFDALPEWMRKVIETTPEWNARGERQVDHADEQTEEEIPF
jgi:hypothetical protein